MSSSKQKVATGWKALEHVHGSLLAAASAALWIAALSYMYGYVADWSIELCVVIGAVIVFYGISTLSPSSNKQLSSKKDTSRVTIQSRALSEVTGGFQFAGLVRSEWADEDHSYDEPDATELQVRGPTYLNDRAKVASAPPLSNLVALDLLTGSQELPWHASESPGSAVAQLRDGGEKRFLFVIHFRLTPLQFVIVLALPAKLPDTPGSKLLQDFIENFSDEERSARLKVIPRVPEGPFLVRSAVPEKPAILGKKLHCRYFHKPGDHFEISVDVFSSTAVQYICNQIVNAVSHITMDLAFLIEAKEASELPEVILGSFRMRHIDIRQARQSVPSTS